jgi:hypothetical protein
VEDLQRIKSSLEKVIFDENTPDNHRKVLIARRNAIELFIELPDDIINIEKLKDVSNTDTSEN